LAVGAFRVLRRFDSKIKATFFKTTLSASGTPVRRSERSAFYDVFDFKIKTPFFKLSLLRKRDAELAQSKRPAFDGVFFNVVAIQISPRFDFADFILTFSTPLPFKFSSSLRRPLSLYRAV